MDSKLNKIEDKIDAIVEDIGEIKITLAKQHVSLDEHIRRSNLLEAKMEPLETHVDMVNGAMKVLALAGLVAGIISALAAVLK